MKWVVYTCYIIKIKFLVVFFVYKNSLQKQIKTNKFFDEIIMTLVIKKIRIYIWVKDLLFGADVFMPISFALTTLDKEFPEILLNSSLD